MVGMQSDFFFNLAYFEAGQGWVSYHNMLFSGCRPNIYTGCDGNGGNDFKLSK